MGQSSSSRRRRSNNYPPTYPPSSTSYLYPPPPPPPPPTASGYYSHVPPPNYANPYPIPTPPPYNNSYSPQLASGYTNLVRFFDSLMGRSQYSHQYPPYYGTDRDNWRWVSSPPSSSSSTVSNLQPMPQYVEHQKAKTIKNDVNVHKDTIRLEVDEQNPDYYLVSFTFDALVDGSVTIYYFAKEGINCSFSPIYVDMYTPTRVPFQKGSGQKFRQPSGSGIDLGFFELDDLSKPLHGDVFPLIIYADACPLPLPTNEQVSQSTAAACAQITQAVIEKHNDGSFQVKVIKQILWVDGERYELQEIFGLVNSAEVEAGDDKVDDMDKECVICLSEPRNTAVLPCRHMCMCSECAKALRLQSNKCPICRQPVEKLMEIKVNSADN